MREFGKVVKLDGNNAVVRIKRRGECDKCRKCKVCGNMAFVETSLENVLDANAGDYVFVDYSRKRAVLLSLAVYSVVFVLAAIGCIIGAAMSGGAMAILGFSGIAVGLAIAIPIDVMLIRKKTEMRMVAFATPEGKEIQYQDDDIKIDSQNDDIQNKDSETETV